MLAPREAERCSIDEELADRFSGRPRVGSSSCCTIGGEPAFIPADKGDLVGGLMFGGLSAMVAGGGEKMGECVPVWTGSGGGRRMETRAAFWACAA
jgi:hypothetical protein